MPRSVQPFRSTNARVTNAPSNTANGGGDPTQAVDDASSVFSWPPGWDLCKPVTNGSSNPFVSGLNDMGDGTGGTTGVNGQTGNMLSGLQIFTDSLCGYALGGTSAGEVIKAAKQLRAQGGDLHETIEALRRLRDTVGPGTTPQSVLAGVEAVTGVVNDNPLAQDAIATGRDAVGVSGNQIIDAVNGGQTHANKGHKLLTGDTSTGASGADLLDAGGNALNQNTANHAGHTSLTTAQSVSLKDQNLLVSQDFHNDNTVVGDFHWSWDGTDGSPSTGVLGCAKVTCDGTQQPLVSSEIPVVAGENIEISCQVKWSGLTYTGTSPIKLAVEKYRLMKDPAGSGKNVYTDIGWYEVATVSTPGLSGGWSGIAGTYETEPGVDQLRFRLEVTSNATAGTVKWDDANFLKLDLISGDAVPATGQTIDSIVTQLYGAAGAGFTQNDAATALANTSSSIESLSAQMTALQAQGHTGAIAGDDFTWVGAIPGGNWGGAYETDGVGSYSSNGAAAVWSSGGAWGQDGTFIWGGSDATSTTDYQLVQLVLGSAPRKDPDGAGTVSYISLCGRMNGTANLTRATFGSDRSWVVEYLSGGTPHTLASGTVTNVPGTGSILSFYLGDAATSAPRHFRLEVGTTIVADFNETGTGSPLGSTQRGWGWGAAAGGAWYTEARPPTVNQWTGVDQ